MSLIQEFQKRAAAAGLSPTQTQAFIATNGLTEKLAEPSPETILSKICEAANVEKSAEAFAYAEGFLTKAAERGLTPEQSLYVTKQALASVFPPAVAAEKQAASQNNDEHAREVYFTGMFEKAAALGFTQEQTVAFIQKQANPGGFGAMLGGLGRSAKQGLQGIGGRLKDAMPSGRSLGALGAGAAAGGAGGYALGQGGPGIGEQLLSLIQQHPELAGALGGAGIGGIAGGLSGSPDEADPNNPEAGQSHVGRNALLGALAGGGVGAGAGHFAPDMFKRLAA